MNKHILILSTAIILSAAPSYAWTPCGTDAQGSKANCEYEVTNGTLTIRGTGSNGNVGTWDTDTLPWKDNFLTNVVIDNSIKDLGYLGFWSIESQNPIIVPSSVTIIGSHAFYSTPTTEIILPNTITSIEKEAFAWSRINQITIPNSVQTIAPEAFRATKLTEVIIPDSVERIGNAAFSRCYDLQSIVIGPNTQLGNIFASEVDDAGICYITLNTLKMYCAESNKQTCVDALKAANATDEQIANIIQPYTKEGNRYVIGDQKFRSLSDMQKGLNAVKRIYTVDEANMASGKKNTVMIRYK